jgi:glycine betaine/choline ABC-type transport system substrate-binding protein
MYAYVQSEESVMRASFKEKRVHDTLDVYDEVYEFFKDKGNNELIEKILIRYLGYGIELTEKTSKSQDIQDKKRVYEYIKSKFEEKAKIAEDKVNKKEYDKIKEEFYEALKIACKE